MGIPELRVRSRLGPAQLCSLDHPPRPFCSPRDAPLFRDCGGALLRPFVRLRCVRTRGPVLRRCVLVEPPEGRRAIHGNLAGDGPADDRLAADLVEPFTDIQNHPGRLSFLASRIAAPPAVTFLPLNVKLEAFKGTLRTEHQTLDRVTAGLLVCLVGAGLVRRRCSIRPSMYVPLAATLGAALTMPASIGTTAVVDVRMPVVVVLLAIASSDWPDWRRRWFVPVVCIFSLLFVIRMGVITDGWLESDRHYRQFTAALDQLPEGTRLLSAIKLASYDSNSPEIRGFLRPGRWSTCPVGASSVARRLCQIYSRRPANSRCN